MKFFKLKPYWTERTIVNKIYLADTSSDLFIF